MMTDLKNAVVQNGIRESVKFGSLDDGGRSQ